MGWNTVESVKYEDYPVYVKYKGLTEAKIIKLASSFERDENGPIILFWFYNDATNPADSPKYWNAYLEKIMFFSRLKPDK